MLYYSCTRMLFSLSILLAALSYQNFRSFSRFLFVAPPLHPWYKIFMIALVIKQMTISITLSLLSKMMVISAMWDFSHFCFVEFWFFLLCKILFSSTMWVIAFAMLYLNCFCHKKCIHLHYVGSWLTLLRPS